MKRLIFGPYIKTLLAVGHLSLPPSLRTKLPGGVRIELKKMPMLQRIRQIIDKLLCALISIVNKNYIVVKNGRIL